MQFWMSKHVNYICIRSSYLTIYLSINQTCLNTSLALVCECLLKLTSKWMRARMVVLQIKKTQSLWNSNMWWTLNCGLFTSSPFKNVAQNWCPHLKTWVQPRFRQDEAKHGVLNNELLIADQQQVGVSVRDQFQPCEPSWDASLLGSWSTRHGWRSRGSCQSPLPGTRPDFQFCFEYLGRPPTT